MITMKYPVATILAGAFFAYVAATIVAGLISRARFPLPSDQNRIGCIDGLRGYLALSVLIHHFIIWMQVTRLDGAWSPPTIFFFNQLGAGGVALFFMTTGFVFYPRVLAGFRDCSWLAIYMTRIFRIVPLIIVSVAIITVVIAARTGRHPDGRFLPAAAKWISTWSEPPLLDYPDSGRVNAYVLWSLWYEWIFYLFVLPACAFATDLIRGRFPSWVIPLTVLALGLSLRLLHASAPIALCLPLFAIGMLAYECQRHEPIARALRTPAMTIAAVVALGFGMIGFPTPYNFAAPLFGLFFVCVACGNSIGGLLRTRGARVLGECSYGIYLLHGIMLSLLFVDASTLTAPFTAEQLPIVLPVVAIAMTLVTPITYLLVERPALRAGSRLAKYWTGRRLRSGAPELDVAP